MNNERSFLYIGGSIVVAVLVLLFLARPAYQDMITSKKDLDKKQTEIASLNQQIKNVGQVAADFKNTPAEKIATLNKHLPNSPDEATFVAQMEAIGKSTRALVTGIDFSDAPVSAKKSAVNEVNVTIVAQGEYKQLMDLIASLEQNIRISTLHDVTIQNSGKTTTARITMSVFYKAGGAKKSNTKVENTTSNVITF